MVRTSGVELPAWLLFVVLFGVGWLAYRQLRRWRTARHRLPAAQAQAGRLPPRAPGGGAPAFCGVRVVELSTYAAAPTAARCLAELGAEVIKIEGPNGCGPGRCGGQPGGRRPVPVHAARV